MKEILSDGKHTPQYFIQRSNVYALCTTDDPVDTLEYHKKIANEKLIDTKILPAYRPDNALGIEKESWRDYISHLSEVSGVNIADWESMTQAMELHMNAMRSCNTKAVEKIGEATGYDSVCDHPLALKLSGFMNELEKTGQLPKMILFSLNDSDNMVISTMLGNFQDSSVPSKIQKGPSWWFQDHADGMEAQMRILANEGILGRFIGMLTDSRSFLSYPRHEYFRRILCNLMGTWVENGQYPCDMETLGMLVERISYLNVKEYLGI